TSSGRTPTSAWTSRAASSSTQTGRATAARPPPAPTPSEHCPPTRAAVTSGAGTRTPERTSAMELEILGSGTSFGVPEIGCECEVCESADPRDQRYRCSVWLRHEGLDLVVDAPPEFRLQC